MIVSVHDLSHPGLAPYSRLTEAQLRNRLHPQQGIFIAESPKVIQRALAAGYEPLSLLCEQRHIEGDAAHIVAMLPAETPIFTGSRELLASLTGYTLTRGVLCAMRRGQLPTVEQVTDGAARIAVLDEVCDATNVGAIFRSAAALGIDGILLSATACDPLNRRAIRTSMGTVFDIPWTWLQPEGNINAQLRQQGLKTAALALTHRSVSLDDPALNAEPRLALILGGEGWGLHSEVIDKADYTVRIPMARGVDSLNVAAAAAVAFWQLRRGL